MGDEPRLGVNDHEEAVGAVEQQHRAEHGKHFLPVVFDD
jgi:hypothetical protein